MTSGRRRARPGPGHGQDGGGLRLLRRPRRRSPGPYVDFTVDHLFGDGLDPARRSTSATAG